jgi:hypothetical protein
VQRAMLTDTCHCTATGNLPACHAPADGRTSFFLSEQMDEHPWDILRTIRVRTTPAAVEHPSAAKLLLGDHVQGHDAPSRRPSLAERRRERERLYASQNFRPWRGARAQLTTPTGTRSSFVRRWQRADESASTSMPRRTSGLEEEPARG